MNNTFNLKRFILLFKKNTLEHAKTYLLSIIVLAGIISITLGFFAYENDGRLIIPVQAVMFIYCIVGSGCIFTSLIFTDLGDKRKATGVLTLPASHLEKYLVSWIYSYVIFQLVFVGVFYLVDFIVITLSHPPVDAKNTLVNIFDLDQSAYIGFVVYALLHAFGIWGAIFFEKLHLIKTLFVFFIWMILIILVNKFLLHFIGNENIKQDMPLSQVNFFEGKQIWSVLPDNSTANFSSYILALFVMILWITSFFRLKEKQI